MAKQFQTVQNLVNSGFVQTSGQTLSLCGYTFIADSGTFKYSSCRHNSYTARSVVDAAYVTGQTTCVLGKTVTGATNGLTKTGQNVGLGGTINSNTIIDLGDFNLSIFSSGATSGLTYADDYSTSFVPNSLVSKIYVDRLVSGSTVIAINGLNKNSGGAIGLGGILSGNTIIDVSGHSFQFGGINTGFYFDDSYISFGNNNSAIGVNETDVTISSSGSALVIATGETTFESGDHAGIKYADDYSLNYSPRSLADAGYVTGITSCLKPDKLTVCHISSSYSATTSDHVILVTGGTPLTVYLPNLGATCDGKLFKIKDSNACAYTNNITIDSGAGYCIDDHQCALINTDYGALDLIYSAASMQWSGIGFLN